MAQNLKRKNPREGRGALLHRSQMTMFMKTGLGGFVLAPTSNLSSSLLQEIKIDIGKRRLQTSRVLRQ